MKLLLLGGTADGRKLAARLHQQGIEVIYSVAGLVRQPKLDCAVISGGFSQRGGLVQYLRDSHIDAVLDVTHPYAQQMSSTAQSSSKQVGIPYWRFHRAPWRAESGDDWREFSCWPDLMAQLKNECSSTAEKTILFSIGQLDSEILGLLDTWHKARAFSGAKLNFIVRTAAAPNIPLLAHMQWLKAIGPFKFDDELTLLKDYQVDYIISKNSGGSATYSKLLAARKRHTPVFMQTRPTLLTAEHEFSDAEKCADFVIKMHKIVKNRINL